ncbi:MAG: PilN domain-containing protein [Neobacillus sp.]
MLVEINLLPQKERGKKGLILMLVSFAVLFIAVGGVYLWQIQQVRSDIAAVDRQIDTTKKLAEIEQNNAGNNEAQLSVTVLKNAVSWADNYPIQTVPVMQHLTALLPERGFIQTFGYTEAGTVTLSVQFDNSREAAYFLDNLNESDYIDEASLSSLTAQELEEAKETATTTGTKTGDDQLNANDSFIVTIDPNDPSRFIFTPVNPNGSESANKEPEVKYPTNKYVPRYLGQFEIKFTKDTIKSLLNKGNGEEVTSS